MARQEYLDICEEVALSASRESAHGARGKVERRWGITPGLSGGSQCQFMTSRRVANGKGSGIQVAESKWKKRKRFTVAHSECDVRCLRLRPLSKRWHR